MSYNYLFETYHFINKQLEMAQKEMCDEDVDEKSKQFAAGRIDALCGMERFITDKFKPILSRRLRNSLNNRLAGSGISGKLVN